MRKRRDGQPPVDQRGIELIEQLANLEPEAIAQFRVNWPEFNRYSDKELLQHRDELRVLCGHKAYAAPGELWIEKNSEQEVWDEMKRWEDSDPKRERFARTLFDEASQAFEHRKIPEQQFICERWMKAEGANWKQDWRGSKPLVTPREDSLCLRLCLLCVKLHPRVRSCDNPYCQGTPYFVASRSDQRFCPTDECAEYGQRIGKMRRWREKRDAEKEAVDQGSEGE